MAASYKVPQDVEAEDKLIGPFSFRQFIYLGIVAMGVAAAWGLFLLFAPLAVIPLPLIIFFGALALPLRKDQPMETYLAAMWQFYIKPRRRMWMADGIVSRITIDMPAVIERQLTKNLTSDQAVSQFDYLSQLADTGGWSSRGVTHAPMAVVDNPEEDIMDNTSTVAQNIASKLQAESDNRREELLAKVHSGSIVSEAPVQQSTPQPASQPIAPGIPDPIDIVNQLDPAVLGPAPEYNPAPKYMQQHVIQPMEEDSRLPVAPQRADQASVPEQMPVEPSASVATPAIMELAKGVSVETVAKQLHHEDVERISDGEVIINLH